MTEDLPCDADGDALRRLIATGSDISKEMEIDFAVDIPDGEAGASFAAVVAPLGFRTSVRQDKESKRWTCYCSCTMVPTYNAMISTQQMLEEKGRPYRARPDGWGSFGNAPE